MNYLYNREELPPLPEWDKKVYPYAVIAGYLPFSPYSGIYLYLSTTPLEFRNKRVTDTNLRPRHDGSMLIYGYGNELFNGSDGTKWEVGSTPSKDFIAGQSVSYPATNGVLWANYDVLNYDDGKLVLPASYPINPETGEEIYDYDPIPIGSAPEVEPKSFMAGSWMGQIVKYYGIGV